MGQQDAPEADAVVGPSGTVYRLAPETMPALERALANREATRAYLLDIIQSVQAAYPPEIASARLIARLGEALRALPLPWLREYAYAGMLAVLQGLEEGGDGEMGR